MNAYTLLLAALGVLASTPSFAHCWSFHGSYSTNTDWFKQPGEVRLAIRQSGCRLEIEDSSGAVSGIYDMEDAVERPSEAFCGRAVPESVSSEDYVNFTSKIRQYNSGAFSFECAGSASESGKDPGGYFRRIGISMASTGSSQLFGLRVGIRTRVNGVTTLRTLEFHRS